MKYVYESKLIEGDNDDDGDEDDDLSSKYDRHLGLWRNYGMSTGQKHTLLVDTEVNRIQDGGGVGNKVY